MTKLAVLFLVISLSVCITEFTKVNRSKSRRIQDSKIITKSHGCIITKKPLTHRQMCLNKNTQKKLCSNNKILTRKFGYPPGVKLGYYRELMEQSNIGDERIGFMRKEWFERKDVLDIGCNVGLFTLTVAKDFGPKSITGIDIYRNVIKNANKNKMVYQNSGVKLSKKINFKRENYALPSDDLLEFVKPEYDTITCLSVAISIHLKYGDIGLQRFFKKIYHNLRPGGRLILEYHNWNYYRKDANVEETLLQKINFHPDKFQDFLITEVGFAKIELFDFKSIFYKRDKRPFMLLTKMD